MTTLSTSGEVERRELLEIRHEENLVLGEQVWATNFTAQIFFSYALNKHHFSFLSGLFNRA
jgi:hypothetical protein